MTNTNISIQVNKLGQLTTVADELATISYAVQLAKQLVHDKKAFIFEGYKLIEVVND